VPLDYEQLAYESAPAFRAFALYRDLGASRSLAKAYAEYRGTTKGICPGQWGLWSGKFRWEQRALAYDAFLDAEKLKLRARKVLELEERRWEFELSNQESLERRAKRMDELIDKAEMSPVADVIVVKDETVEDINTGSITKTRTKTSVKALKMAGYSRTIQVRNETAAEAINGVRTEKKRKEAASSTAQKPTGIVYRPAIEDVPAPGVPA
jgi:hypothetical protein